MPAREILQTVSPNKIDGSLRVLTQSEGLRQGSYRENQISECYLSRRLRFAHYYGTSSIPSLLRKQWLGRTMVAETKFLSNSWSDGGPRQAFFPTLVSIMPLVCIE